MTKATIQIPKDTSRKHKIVIPREIWGVERLQEGDFVEIDVKKIENPRIKEAVYHTIRVLGGKTGLTYQQIRDVFPSEHPEDIINALEELLREGRISGDPSGYRAL